MPKIIVTKGFKFAHHGYQVQEFEAGPEPIETTEEVAKWVVEHQHGKKAKKSSAADTAAQDALRVRIAELEPLLASATDDATKAALSQELNAKRSELDALQV